MSSNKKRPATSLWQALLLIVISPIIVLILAEVIVRVSKVDTELARNNNFDVAVPAWLLADNNWVSSKKWRANVGGGIKAQDVAMLNDLEEARFIEYKMKPNLNVEAVNSFNEIDIQKGIKFGYHTNSDGFRTREFSPKSDSSFRVVVIGDSSTFGWGVDDKYTYPELLGDRLRLAGKNAEIFNLGVPGYSSRHGIEILDHYALGLQPNVLVISFGANDKRPAVQSADSKLSADYGWRGMVKFSLLKLESIKLLRKLIFSVYDPFLSKPGEPLQTRPAVAPEEYSANLTKMVNEARAAGMVPVFLSVCTRDDYVKVMKNVAESEHVEIVDAGQLFQQNLDALRTHRKYPEEVLYTEGLYGIDKMNEDSTLYVTTDGCHPNRAGQSIIADGLADAIARSSNAGAQGS